MMETLGDLLHKVQEFGTHEFNKDEAERIFGWPVEDVGVSTAEKEETSVLIAFKNGLALYAWYFLNLDPTETEDTCEFMLRLRTDLKSSIKYNVFYSGYIHGQGYIRLQIEEMDNVLAQRMAEDFYAPGLKMIYKPIIIQFRGFYSRDYFGVESGRNRGEIYYSTVRSRSENKDLEISKVIGRLHELDSLLREPEVRHNLAELDLQLSFLPSIVWSKR
ncbi:Uncharacterised protein [uncultured archaeon]|nr:Uncharacterised protein [uncultured archaeon]